MFIQSHDILIWSLAPASVAARHWAALETTLEAGERAQAARFHFDVDRCAYIAGHALLRGLLSHVVRQAPDAWRFAPGRHGKPRIVEPEAYRGLGVNLTHARGMVAAAVSAAVEIGIDVDSATDRSAGLEIANRFFAPEEIAGLHALADGGARQERFIRLWTLKEAFIKATGKGLAQPLSDFAFVSVEPARVVFRHPALGDPSGWVFWQERIGCHYLALAVDWPSPTPPRIHHRAVSVPLPIASPAGS